MQLSGNKDITTMVIMLTVIFSFLTFTAVLTNAGYVCNDSATDACEICRCNFSLRSGFFVYCDFLNLTKVPKQLPRLTASLNLSNNQIEFLYEDDFSNIPTLLVLDLSDNHLAVLPENVFASNKLLSAIELSDNLLETLPANVFNFTRILQAIGLQNNSIRYLPEDFFFATPMLRWLNLADNDLTSIPERLLENAPDIVMLHLSDNRIQEIPEGLLSNAGNLTVIGLSGNLLETLPAKIFASTNNIKEIALSDNLLKTLPGNIFTFTNNLETLGLENNSLKYLPEEIFFNTPKLEWLNLEENNLTSIPKKLLEHTLNISTISFAENELRELPETLFANAFNLTMIDLSRNALEALPANIFAFNNNLKEIDLADNCLETLPGGIFDSTNNLEAVNLVNNPLKYLSENIFFNTPMLQWLSFGENNLTSLPERLLEITPFLETLKIVDTLIESIPEGFLSNIKQLEYLLLPGNNIMYLPRGLFCNVDLTGILDFSMNAIEEIPLELFNFHNRSHTLTDLFLHKNSLKYLQSGLFSRLANLTKVCLFENKILFIGTGVFSGTAIKVYLFANMLENFSYDSFNGDLKTIEVHLYRNNVTTISGNVTRRRSDDNILYVDCWNLKQVYKLNLTLNCVGEKFTPELHLSNKYDPDAYLARTLTTEGFTCSLNPITEYFNCTTCPQGSYANWENECVPCPKGGFYLDDIGATSSSPGAFLCKLCFKGTYVKEIGGRSLKDCVECPEGTNKSIHAGFRACFCKNGFARRERFEKCFPCKHPGLQCTKYDFQSLKPGFFWYWNFPNASIDEYNAFAVNLLDNTRFYDNNTGYFREIPRVHKCPRPDSCTSNFDSDKSVEGTCADGYEGWACSKCAAGYYSVYSACFRCPDIKVLVLEMGLIICLVTSLVFAIWRNNSNERKTIRDRTTTDVIVSRAKILLGFYQVVGKYLSSVCNIKVEAATQFTSEIIFAVDMNILKFCLQPKCLNKRFVINPKVQFVIATSFLFIIAAFPFVLRKIVKFYHHSRYRENSCNGNRINLNAKFLTLAVFVIFITYPPVCFSIFQLLPGACEYFCMDLNSKHCFSGLRSDYDVRCNKQLIAYQMLAVIATVGYVLAFPLALLHMLRKYSSEPLSEVEKGKEDNTVQSNIKHFKTEDKRGNHLPQCLKFLSENYKSEYWYWEIVELVRKVTQTVLITIFGWGNKFTVLLTIGISVVFLLIHAMCRPMRSDWEQALQMFSLAAILTNIVFLGVQMPNKYEGLLSLSLILLNMSVIVVICLEIFVVSAMHLKADLRWRISFNLYKASTGFKRFQTGDINGRKRREMKSDQEETSLLTLNTSEVL